MKTSDPILAKFRQELDKLYGERIDRVMLYGSRARGDARPDSDYDVAVFLKDLADRWVEMDRMAVIATGILSETGAVIHAMAYTDGTYLERTPLMHEMRREGVEV